VSSPRRIGPFALAEVIGEGQSTGLYRAVRVDGARLPRQVAIRAALNPADPTSADRVHREHEVLRVLDDPRIPRIYGHYPDEAALAMGFVDGITLADIIYAASRDWVALESATVMDITIEVAHALRHAHSVRYGTGTRIVHGHLGPQRIRLEPTGNVVVVGLGAASRGRHPAYTAPEVAQGGIPSRASDQWSLGATLVQMLLGERIYAGRRKPDEAALEGDVTPWTRRVERAHPEVAAALRKMLAVDPEARFQSEPEMLKALLAASRRMGGTVHRRHLVARVMLHADKLHAMRPERPSVIPLPLPSELGPQEPEVDPGHPPTPARPEPEVQPMTHETHDPHAAGEPIPVEAKVDQEREAPPAIVDIPIAPEDEIFDPVLPDPGPGPTFAEDGRPDPDLEPTAPVESPDRDPLAPLPPEPTAAFLPTEIIGMVAGAMMFALGIWYCIEAF